jgi:hypothetical protein
LAVEDMFILPLSRSLPCLPTRAAGYPQPGDQTTVAPVLLISGSPICAVVGRRRRRLGADQERSVAPSPVVPGDADSLASRFLAVADLSEAELYDQLDAALIRLSAADEDLWLGPKEWAKSAKAALDILVAEHRVAICVAWQSIPGDRRDDSQAVLTAIEAVVGTKLGLPAGHEVVGLVTSILIRRGLDRLCA